MRIEAEHFRLANLYVRSYRPVLAHIPKSIKGVILFVHGATISSTLFDLPVPGYSLMQACAEAGWWTFACDLTGYGLSARPQAMDEAPTACPVICSGTQALADTKLVTQAILDRTGHLKLCLVGGSWGSLTAARFAIEKPQLVERLVLIAPLFARRNEGWLNTLSDPKNPSAIHPELGGYRYVDIDALRSRWDPEIPPGEENKRRDPAVLEAMFNAELAADANAKDRRAFRVPNGTLHDLHQVFQGHSLYEPENLQVPCLLTRGDQDQTSTRLDMQALYDRIGSRSKKAVTLRDAGHFIQAERSASILGKVILDYLNEPTVMTAEK
jgi:pimeloyl-ACP methyl ester carboxylesterase